MTIILGVFKAGLMIGISVLLTLTILEFNPSSHWVEVDMVKLIQRHALQLGKQSLSEGEVKEEVANFMARVQKIAKKLSKQHKVILIPKGVTLFLLPDWTNKIAQQLEVEK